MAVCIRKIRLNIEDGRSADQIGAPDVKHRPLRCVPLDARQRHGGQPQPVRPEGRPGGKHAHAGVAPQTGRPNSRRPVLPQRSVKLPDQPDVGKILQPPQGLRLAVGRFKDDAAGAVGHAALPWDAKFLRKGRFNAGDGCDVRHGQRSRRPVSVRWALISLGRRSRRTISPATMTAMPATMI